MILIDKVRSWLGMHMSVLTRKPNNGRGSVQELDILLMAISEGTKEICATVERVERDTARLKRLLEQNHASPASKR